MKTSYRSQTAPFIAMDVLSKAAALETSGVDIIHMEVGEPAYGAPKAAFEAVQRSKDAGATMGYTSGLGLPELREGISKLYLSRYGLSVDPSRVIVTAGSSAGFVLSFLSVFDPGDRIAIADPGYPCYRNILRTLALEPVQIRSTLSDRYQPTSAQIADAGGADGLLIASPANPTGTMLTHSALKAIVEYTSATRITLISDEIYHGLTYDDRAVSALEFSDDVIVINSFSKYYAMTGWRIGWMIVPNHIVRTIQNLAQNLFICPSHVSQIAALGALSEEGEAEVAKHIDDYRVNRQVVISTLQELGFREIAPCDGAFYTYAGLPEGFEDSLKFCDALLNDVGVAATPGVDFDPKRGNETVRFSFAQSPTKIVEGMQRLRHFVSR